MIVEASRRCRYSQGGRTALVAEQLVEQQADALTRLALRHRRGAKSVERYARRLLRDRTTMLDTETGRLITSGTKGGGEPLRRPILPHELAQATTLSLLVLRCDWLGLLSDS